jgi:integrase
MIKGFMDELPLTDELKADILNYITHIDGRINSQNTIRSYANILDRMFKKFKVLSHETSKQMIVQWNKKTKIRAVLNKINEYLDYNSINFSVKIPKSIRKDRNIPDILTREELLEVVKKMQPVEKLIISCIFNIGAGLRISELINLSWEDIDWQLLSIENKTITAVIRHSKRDRSRVVPIPHFTTAELYEYAESIGHIGEDGYPQKGKIFDFGRDSFKTELRVLEPKKWENEYIIHAYDYIRHNIIRRYFKSVGNKNITAHSLRHSRASELYNVYNIPIPKIQAWLGHKDISTTMIYVHLANKEDKKLMETIGGI